MASTKTPVDIEGRRLMLSNLGKVLYPDAGFTKSQIIDYHARIAPVLLPHLHRRPLSMKRYPDGVDGESFFEKRCPKHRPDWVETAQVYVSDKDGLVPFCVIDDLPTLVWVANLASLELHTQLHRAEHQERPDMVVFDLDPGAPAGMLDCVDIAFRLRELFTSLGLEAFPKTSGGKGLHLAIPLNTDVSYDATKSFALEVAKRFEKELPDRVVHRMRQDLRSGKVFIDWSQNDIHKTTVSVYSLRARPRPTVSTPVTWDELEEVREREDPSLITFEAPQVLERVAEHGDLHAPILTLEQALPAALPA